MRRGLGAGPPDEPAGCLAEVLEEQPGQVPLADARRAGQGGGAQVAAEMARYVVDDPAYQLVPGGWRRREHAHLRLVAGRCR